MQRPTFFVLGAPKCGTTSLCDYLSQHPDVFIPRSKEPVFFESQYERGLDYYWERYFGGWSGESAVGDGRTYHLFLPFVARRIRESVPAARLIAILRDPVARAHSHWWHRFVYHNESLPFEDAVAANLDSYRAGALRFDDPDGPRRWRESLLHPTALSSRHRLYLEVGLYARQLEAYRALFPADQLAVVLYDDLCRDPRGVVAGLWRFLGVEDRVELQSLEPRNRAPTRMRRRWVARLDRIAGSVARRLPAPLREGARRMLPGHRRVAELIPGREVTRPPIPPDTRERLREFYREPNRELARLLGRDLSGWETDPAPGELASQI